MADVTFAENALISVVETWGVKQDVCPILSYHGFDGASQSRRYCLFANQVGELDPNLYHQRVQALITLGLSFNLSNCANLSRKKVATAINSMYAQLSTGCLAKGFKSYKYMIQDALILAAIYTSHHPPEKCCMYNWMLQAPISNRVAAYDDNHMFPFLVAAKVTNHYMGFMTPSSTTRINPFASSVFIFYIYYFFLSFWDKFLFYLCRLYQQLVSSA
ncbi:hypothetical protein DSO57_1021546 [Entomophthora muscae]|uniref:Uncharacterized protein n=1 Tax=Entomophthora muscae TaxID=34485 RepID=A0ACC2T391_9FUNG|nr:hypothetical protein DSO57_1021546 [Entomophthora muscae]